MEIRCESSLLAILEAQARAAAPAEACGLLAGERSRHGWRLTEFILVTNRNPKLGAFLIDPLEFLRVHADFEARGQQLCACFHSHLSGTAALSANDLRSAWPELIQVICAPYAEQGADFAAWQIYRGQASRLKVHREGA